MADERVIQREIPVRMFLTVHAQKPEQCPVMVASKVASDWPDGWGEPEIGPVTIHHIGGAYPWRATCNVSGTAVREVAA